MSVETMVAKISRNKSATPVPNTIPVRRCFCGKFRQASAITMALSPDSRTLIQII